MKFLIDAQLPRRLAATFQQAGLEAIHTLDGFAQKMLRHTGIRTGSSSDRP